MNPLSGLAATMASLYKIRINGVVALSTVTGFLFAGGTWGADLAFAVLGVFVLGCGSSAMNQVQDASLDSKMDRTRGRPIVRGELGRGTALFLSLITMLFGLGLLASVSHEPEMVAVLGLAAVFWYNALYTPLKRYTAFAVVPGSVIGAIPPVIGWTAAGGVALHPNQLLLASFLFIWQIPHFWLLQLNHARDYSRAGLPTLNDLFDVMQLCRITTAWLWATAAAGVGVASWASPDLGFGWRFAMVVASMIFAMSAAKQLSPSEDLSRQYRRAFAEINTYAVAIMLCLCLGSLT